MLRFMHSIMVSLAVFAAGAVSAQEYPQLFEVVDVSSDDVLNIRQDPSASSSIVGTLAPDATDVEVIMLNTTQRWGMVNHNEGTGWVSMRYLQGQGQHIDNFNMPVGLSCYGTEPFWSLQSEGGVWHFDSLNDPPADLKIDIAQDSGIAQDFRRMVRLTGPDGPATAFIYPATCNDGMSDFTFGLSISLMTGPSAPLLSGCCRLGAR